MFVDFTVEESKKRWRSLRDAFMKQYKCIGLTADENFVGKKKKWLFYEQMKFLSPYLDFHSATLEV